MESQALITWPDPLIELAGFIGAFLATGAVGFRYSALRRFEHWSAGDPQGLSIARRAARMAATLGLLGAIIGLGLFVLSLPEMADRRHTTVAALLAGTRPVQIQLGSIVVALLGSLLAAAGAGIGWPLLAIGVVAGALRSAIGGQWLRLVNPLHVLFGGFWIGSLFVLVVVGIPAVMRSPLDPDRRGQGVASMVNAFSPLALVSAALLACMGVITAWTHLHRIENLWTTPYGITLIIKLCVVLCVVAVGAWNWRRQRPRLGSEEAAYRLGRSASAELTLAAIVLAITSILVSLPSPRPPRAAGARTPAVGQPAGPPPGEGSGPPD